MTTVVRRADLKDIPWLQQQLLSFAHFYGSEHPLFPDDEQEARDFLASVISEHICLIAQRPDNGNYSYRCGLIAGLVAPSLYNKSLIVATELWWWVAPKFRGGTVGARLLLEFEECAFRAKATRIALSLLQRSIDDKLVDADSLVRRGYALQELTFLKSLQEVGV